MDLKKYLTLAGRSGIFRSVAQTKNGLIVESLVEKNRFAVGFVDKASFINDIGIFGYNEDIPMNSVMEKIYAKESGGPAINPKSPDAELRRYFSEVLPEYNKEKVFVSDIRKVLTWYNILQSQGLLIPGEESKGEDYKNSKNKIHDKE